MKRRGISLANQVRARLKRMAAGADPKLAQRARIVLLASRGKSDAQICAALKISRKTCWRWRTRFAAGGLAAIESELPRTGRKPTVREHVAQLIVDATLSGPPEGEPRWSTRRLAKALGVSRAMVHRVWQEHGLSPPEAPPPAPKE